MSPHPDATGSPAFRLKSLSDAPLGCQLRGKLQQSPALDPNGRVPRTP
jgi:hypothetical protein